MEACSLRSLILDLSNFVESNKKGGLREMTPQVGIFW